MKPDKVCVFTRKISSVQEDRSRLYGAEILLHKIGMKT